MFVQDVNGNWYEVNDEQLKGKQIDNERVREATVALRAEKRKKVADLLGGLDAVEVSILGDELAARSSVRSWAFAGWRYMPRADCPECQCPECQCPECQCPECQCPECSCPECSSINPWMANTPSWGGMRFRPAWRGMSRMFR